jgi:hypothetical protein
MMIAVMESRINCILTLITRELKQSCTKSVAVGSEFFVTSSTFLKLILESKRTLLSHLDFYSNGSNVLEHLELCLWVGIMRVISLICHVIKN